MTEEKSEENKDNVRPDRFTWSAGQTTIVWPEGQDPEEEENVEETD